MAPGCHPPCTAALPRVMGYVMAVKLTKKELQKVNSGKKKPLSIEQYSALLVVLHENLG